MDFTILGLLFVTIIGWGLWGFFQKIGVTKIGVEACLFLHVSMELLVVISYFALIQRLHIPRNWSLIYPMLGGISAAIGTITFFKVLETVPVSIARPITELAVLVTVLLGVVLLHEVLTVKHYLGIGMAIVAVYLLSS